MKDKALDCIRFENFSDMLENIFEAIDTSEDYIYATIVGKYKEISEILNLVISCYAVEIGDITLCSEDCKGVCVMCGKNLNKGQCDCKKPIVPRLEGLLQFLE